MRITSPYILIAITIIFIGSEAPAISPVPPGPLQNPLNHITPELEIENLQKLVAFDEQRISAIKNAMSEEQLKYVILTRQRTPGENLEDYKKELIEDATASRDNGLARIEYLKHVPSEDYLKDYIKQILGQCDGMGAGISPTVGPDGTNWCVGIRTMCASNNPNEKEKIFCTELQNQCNAFHAKNICAA